MKRLKPKERKAEILNSALVCADIFGYKVMTREQIAHRAQVSEGLINAYYNTMPQLRRSVMRAAIKRELLSIIAQGIVAKDPHAMKISETLKKRALASTL